MAITLEKLRTPITEDEALGTLLGYLTDVGFNATSWQEGSLQRLFIRVFAIVYSDLTSLVAALADFSYNETSTGDALTAFSASHYDNTRSKAVAAVGSIKLTNNGAVPYTISAGAVVVAYVELDGTQRSFRNSTGGSLAAGGGTLTLTWVAETAGAASNIPNNSILVLLTPLAGVTASNPPIAGTSSWMSTAGVDQESDALIRTRNRTKWATLSVESIKETTINVALSASPTITRVAVDDANPRGAGTVDVYIAGATTTSGSSDVAAAQTALAKRFFGSDRVRTYAAASYAVDLVGTVYYDPRYTAVSIQAAVETALLAFVSSAPIGGFDYTPGPSHIVAKNDIENAVKNAAINGQSVVRTVTLSTPAGDITIPSFGVAVRGTWLLSYVPVTS